MQPAQRVEAAADDAGQAAAKQLFQLDDDEVNDAQSQRRSSRRPPVASLDNASPALNSSTSPFKQRTLGSRSMVSDFSGSASAALVKPSRISQMVRDGGKFTRYVET